MALRTLKALWASGDKFPITTLEFVLNLGWYSSGQEKYRVYGCPERGGRAGA